MDLFIEPSLFNCEENLAKNLEAVPNCYLNAKSLVQSKTLCESSDFGWVMFLTQSRFGGSIVEIYETEKNVVSGIERERARSC